MKGKINLNTILKTGTFFAFLAIAFSIAYYFVYFLPQKERVKSEQQEKQYQACLQKCDAKYPEPRINFKAFEEGIDYQALYQTCNFECSEKYAKPLIFIELPGLPPIELFPSG